MNESQKYKIGVLAGVGLFLAAGGISYLFVQDILQSILAGTAAFTVVWLITVGSVFIGKIQEDNQ